MCFSLYFDLNFGMGYFGIYAMTPILAPPTPPERATTEPGRTVTVLARSMGGHMRLDQSTGRAPLTEGSS